jgi:putative FmdB family regulatory protein
MPTYDYRCLACDHEFEEFQSMTADPLQTCPACGKDQLKRLIGAGAGIIFKGSGFYETDYRSKDYKDKAKQEQQSDGGEGNSGGESKSSAGESTSGGAEASGSNNASTGSSSEGQATGSAKSSESSSAGSSQSKDKSKSDN